MEFQDKHILITGAGSGFGLAAAQRFAEQGGRIIAVDRQEKRAHELVASLPSIEGGGHVAIVRDLQAADAAEGVVRDALGHVPRIDVLVNSAGVCHFNRIDSIPTQEWDEVMDIDVRALFYMAVQVGESMKADGKGGRIINLGSNAGRKGRALSAHYAAAKAAVASLSESLALAYGPHGITVNTVCPAVVVTPMWEQNFVELGRLTGKTPAQLLETWTAQTPLKRLGTPEDVADLILFLAGGKASFITAQEINVCGGFMLTC